MGRTKFIAGQISNTLYFTDGLFIQNVNNLLSDSHLAISGRTNKGIRIYDSLTTNPPSTNYYGDNYNNFISVRNDGAKIELVNNSGGIWIGNINDSTSGGAGIRLNGSCGAGIEMNGMYGGGITCYVGSSGGFRITDSSLMNGGLNVELQSGSPIQLYSGNTSSYGSIIIQSAGHFSVSCNQNPANSNYIVISNKSTVSNGGGIVLNNHNDTQHIRLQIDPITGAGIEILNPYRNMVIQNNAIANGGITIQNDNNGEFLLIQTANDFMRLIHSGNGTLALHKQNQGSLILQNDSTDEGIYIANNNSGGIVIQNTFNDGSGDLYLGVANDVYIKLNPANGITFSSPDNTTFNVRQLILKNGVVYKYVFTSSWSYYVDAYQNNIICDTTSNNINVYLPTIDDLPTGILTGTTYTIKNIGANTVTINASGSQYIDGSATQTLSQWGSIVVVAYYNGSAYFWAIV